MYYKIDALDSWFFRNSAPFDASINMSAESIFPPFPSVYAGAFRNCAVPIFNEERSKNTFARSLKIAWNGVIANGRILFPAPLDLCISENKSEKFLAREMVLSSSAGSSAYLPYFLHTPGKIGKPPFINGGGYLDENAINNYLNSKSSNYSVYALGEYLSKETHIGISIDPDLGTAVAGQFYQQTLITPKKITHDNIIHHCSLALEATGIEIPEKSIVRIGGDAKLGTVSHIEEELPLPEPPSIESDCCFKLYLSTPAVFEKGWLPGWINKENMTGIFTYKKRSVRVKLFSAAVGKPIAVGGFGFDRDKNGCYPTEMRFAVPAGSVYYFKLLDGSMTDVIRLFHKRCISDYRETLGFHYERRDRLRYCSRGFGYSFVGTVGENQRGEVKDV